jgi:hypothetical protein
MIKYDNINSYIEYITGFDIVSVLKPGNVYAFIYKSSLDYPDDVLKFFDIMPLAFITDLKSDSCFGFNFHHMPIPERLVWLRKINLIARIMRFASMSSNVNLKWLTYQRMKKVYSKSNRVIRQYLNSRIYIPRIIPFENLPTVLKFYARTYYGVGINQVSRKFYNI